MSKTNDYNLKYELLELSGANKEEVYDKEKEDAEILKYYLEYRAKVAPIAIKRLIRRLKNTATTGKYQCYINTAGLSNYVNRSSADPVHTAIREYLNKKGLALDMSTVKWNDEN